RAVLTADGDTIRVRDLPPQMRPAGLADGATGAPLPSAAGGDVSGRTLDEIVGAYRRQVVAAALEKSGGNKSAAARALGITPRMIYYELGRAAHK
ncbi:MAG: hypothetical protein IJP66_03380, partial [Kiritimatiellae bacterium]|nr:hypothetical protein [Kiritimatiellia bacterium]